MAYDIFSQPTGPNIDVNLFPQSAALGSQTGLALGSPLSNIVSGAQEGLSFGQKFRANQEAIESEQQQQELRQHQIERLPQTDTLQDQQIQQNAQENQIRQHQIERLPQSDTIQDQLIAKNTQDLELDKLKEEANRIILEDAKSTRDLNLEATKADLSDKISKAGSDIDDRRAQSEFYKQWSSYSPRQKADAFFSGQFNQAFAGKDDIYKIALRDMTSNVVRSELSLPEQRRLDIEDGSYKTNAAYQEKARLQQGAFDTANSEYEKHPITSAMQGAFPGVPNDKLEDLVNIEPTGKFEKNPDGFVKTDKGRWLPVDKYDAKEHAGYVDVISKDGKFLGQSIPDTGYVVKRTEFTKQRNLQNGSTARGAVKDLTDEINSAYDKVEGKQAPEPATPANYLITNKQSATPFVRGMAEKLGVSSETAPLLSVPLARVENSLASYIKHPEDRAMLQQELGTHVTSLARAISDSEFEAEPTLAAPTADWVKEWNQAVANATTNSAIYDFFKVSDLKGAYFQKRRAVLEAKINSVLDAQNRSAAYKEISPIKQAAANNASNEYLKKIIPNDGLSSR